MMAREWKKLFARVPYLLAGCQKALGGTTSVSTCVRYVICMQVARRYVGTETRRELHLIRQVC